MTQRTARPRTLGRLLAVCAVAISMAGLASCASDDSDAQPAPGQPQFVEGGFDDLPRYPGSDDAGTRSEEGDVVTQSFVVDGVDPELIVDFYANERPTWETTGPTQAGEALRQEFLSPGGDLLEVSAIVVSRGGDDLTQSVQYSLVFRQG